MSPAAQRDVLDLAQSFNHETLDRDQYDPDVEGVIQSYELAYKMQAEMPEVMDISKESEATKAALRDRGPGEAREWDRREHFGFRA